MKKIKFGRLLLEGINNLKQQAPVLITDKEENPLFVLYNFMDKERFNQPPTPTSTQPTSTEPAPAEPQPKTESEHLHAPLGTQCQLKRIKPESNCWEVAKSGYHFGNLIVYLCEHHISVYGLK